MGAAEAAKIARSQRGGTTLPGFGQFECQLVACVIDEHIELFGEAVLVEFEKLAERRGVLGATETDYQGDKVQASSAGCQVLPQHCAIASFTPDQIWVSGSEHRATRSALENCDSPGAVGNAWAPSAARRRGTDQPKGADRAIHRHRPIRSALASSRGSQAGTSQL